MFGLHKLWPQRCNDQLGPCAKCNSDNNSHAFCEAVSCRRGMCCAIIFGKRQCWGNLCLSVLQIHLRPWLMGRMPCTTVRIRPRWRRHTSRMCYARMMDLPGERGACTTATKEVEAKIVSSTLTPCCRAVMPTMCTEDSRQPKILIDDILTYFKIATNGEGTCANYCFEEAIFIFVAYLLLTASWRLV